MKFVRGRASDCCEYCQLSQEGQEATFHIDHVCPISEGGRDDVENLALACVSCSLRKGAREKIVAPETSEMVSVFSPRSQSWEEHFCWEGVRVVGKTATGRATVEALRLNRSLIIAIRSEEIRLGRFFE